MISYLCHIHTTQKARYFSDKTPNLSPTFSATFTLSNQPIPYDLHVKGQESLESRVVGIFDANYDKTSGDPGFVMQAFGESDYIIPIGNKRGACFFGETEDGSTIKGIRLNYD